MIEYTYKSIIITTDNVVFKKNNYCKVNIV